MALYLFGIGGTGSRVIKSLVMLLASGVKINTDIIYPIIIDPDKNNGDLELTINTLKEYCKVRGGISNFTDNHFFETEFKTLNETNGKEFRLDLAEIQAQKFKEYIGYDHLSSNSPNKALTELLFSESNLNLDMQVGFKGNPNIGSVALNQFNHMNSDFLTFANNFNSNDRIFIISSIFGGTGAAGFPLLIKNIRNADSSIPSSQLLSNACIGGITVLPYFKLNPGEIDSKDFISKTKAALYYYNNNLNSSVNAFYYTAFNDDIDTYDNKPGSNNQKNKAHIVEMASALSIIDFMSLDNPKNLYKEFGVKKASNQTISFDDLGEITNGQISKPLTQYKLLSSYFSQLFDKSINSQPWTNRGKLVFNTDFINGAFYKSICSFNKIYEDWLNEISNNKPSFTPFETNINENNLLGLVMKHTSSSKKWKPNYVLFDEYLNKSERELDCKNLNDKLMTLFYNATDNLVTKEIKL
ncbi:MAG: hypothetical protein ACOYO1_11255 [Bacteroidales bacterium]